MIEVWKKVINCPDFLVSSLGNVKGFDPKLKVWTIRSQNKGSHGYLMVNLRYENGDRGSECVHALVCRVFHGEKTGVLDACHKNGKRYDNRAENLRWGTRLQNINDQKMHGTFGWRGKCKLKESDVLEIVRRIDAGDGINELAKEYGVSHGVISGINLGNYWANITKRKRGDAPKNSRRGNNVRGILNDSAVKDIIKRLDAGETQSSIAKMYKVKPQTISEINRGKIWGWLTGRPIKRVEL